MTLAPELAPVGVRTLDVAPKSTRQGAPADTIPLQSGPSMTVSLTDGCELPMDALKTAGTDVALRCNPCDEAIVRLLIVRTRHSEDNLSVSPLICPGTLCLG